MEIIFNNDIGILQIDGCVIHKNTFSLSNGAHSLLYVDKYKSVFTTIEVVNGNVLDNENYIIAKINNNLYYLELTKNTISPQPDAYFQDKISNQKTHYITIYKSLNYHYLTIETQEEIFNKTLPGKLNNINISSSNISNGILISLMGSIDNYKYIEIIHYSDDYSSIFNCLCNDIKFENDNFIIDDNMNDSIGRVVRRYLSFDGNNFVEQKREFSYKYRPTILKETIPYIFLESLFAKDFNYASIYLYRKESILDVSNLIGNFDKILTLADKNEFDNRVYLLYKEKSQNIIRSFDFIIKDNLIEQILPIVP